MKNLLYLFFAITLLSCSDPSDTNSPSVDDTNPVYLDSNGITIKAKDWATDGDSGSINGSMYTIINAQTLATMVEGREDVTKLCTSRITNMKEMFWSADDFNQDIGSWDVSSVTNMRSLFSRAIKFNQDIGSWDVGKVTDMQFMFWSADDFNQDIGSWDVSSVTYMQFMFTLANSFNQDIGSWDVSSVTNMYYMFNYTSVFNQNLGSWSVDNVENYQGFSADTPQWILPKPNF